MSPEIYNNHPSFDGHAVDVWALGPIVYKMIVGVFPICNTDLNQSSKFVIAYIGYNYFHRNLRQLVNVIPDLRESNLSGELVDLLEKMFSPEPQSRLSLEQIRNSNWMTPRQN